MEEARRAAIADIVEVYSHMGVPFVDHETFLREVPTWPHEYVPDIVACVCHGPIIVDVFCIPPEKTLEEARDERRVPIAATRGLSGWCMIPAEEGAGIRAMHIVGMQCWTMDGIRKECQQRPLASHPNFAEKQKKGVEMLLKAMAFYAKLETRREK